MITFSIPQEVVELRRQIAELKADIGAIDRVPLSDTEAHKRVDIIVATHAGRVSGRLLLGHLIHDGPTSVQWPLDHTGATIEPSAFDLACLVDPERMRANLRALIASSTHPRGAAPGERAKRLAKLRNELRAAEIEEERLIVDFDARGVNVHRRPECEPEIVLTTKE